MNTSALLTDAEARVKYFYHIDVRKVYDQIMALDSYKHLLDSPASSTAVADFFYDVFDIVFVSCGLYTQYLNPNADDHASFFGTTKPWQTEATFRNFLILSLRNHCILHGFHSSLSQTSTREINRQNDTLNKQGFYGAQEHLSIPDYQKPSKQLISNLKKYRLQDFSSKFSMGIFNLASPLNPNEGHRDLVISSPYSVAYDFLFYTNTVQNIDQNLISIRNAGNYCHYLPLWRNYSLLEEKYNLRVGGTILKSRHEVSENENSSKGKNTASANREKNLKSDLQDSTFEAFRLKKN